MPLVRWLATRSRSTTAGPAPKTPKEASRGKKKAGDDGNTRAVLVKVGDDAVPYNLVKLPGVVRLDRMSLLKALQRDEGFAPDLAGVALQRCTVHVRASASDEEPSADEAKTAAPLKGAKTLGALAATAPPSANLFVRVTLPRSAATASDTLPPSHAMTTLARAILAAPAPTADNPHITLSGAVWPILKSPVLFVRDFYDAFYTGVLGGARTGYTKDGVNFRNVCVTGNPGIGKSSFGYFALFRALRDGRTVVYQAEKLSRRVGGDEAYLFNGATVSTDVRAISAAQLDPDTVFISDSIAPVVVDAFTLYVTSPRRERTWEYRKTDGASMRYFPVLSWEEIVAMRAACFPHVSEDDAKERYSRWGGIPRYVLAHTDEERGVLEGAINGIQVEDLSVAFDEPGERNDDSKGSHRVFHIKVHGEVDETLRTNDPAYYKFLSREFASTYVANEVARRGTALQREEMVRLSNKSEGHREMAVARGHVFEVLALERLSRGGRFPMRKLGAPALQGGDYLELPPARRRTFHSPHTELPADEQLEPASKSFSAIDVLLVGHRLANATSGKTHGIVLRGVRGKIGLEAVAVKLGLEGVIPFFWIVPPSVFHAWETPQPLCVGKSMLKPEDVARDKIASRVEQYVVQVDVSAPEAPLASWQPSQPASLPPQQPS